MLGEPMTPLFSVTDFISFEPNHVGLRYVGDILEDDHVIGVVGAAEYSSVCDAGRRTILLVFIVWPAKR
jgi:hypothetical protein